MHLTKRRRRRWTTEQIEQILQQYFQSGETQRGFAEQNGIGLSTFQRWLHRCDEKPVPASVTQTRRATLVEVDVAPAQPRSHAPRSYRLDLPGGISLRLEGGFDAGEVEQLLRVLR